MAEFTVRRARQHSLPHLGQIRARIIRMAAHWSDLDESIIARLDELGRDVDALEREMAEAVEYAEACARERADG